MNGGFAGDQLARLSGFIEAKMALHFPPTRWSELENKIRSAARELGASDAGAFMDELLSSSLTMDRMETLASNLTTGETYFWREPRIFDALEARIVPEIMNAREEHGDRRLRVWCAGCSTGEEAYSIAIALHRALPRIDDWNVAVLATDINPRSLLKAKAGIYGEQSFRNAPSWLAERYFRQSKNGKREVIPEVRKTVSFSYLNLAEDKYPSALNGTASMDIVFCRNVLMYFTGERLRTIVGQFHQSLVDSGWLVVAACECSQDYFREFETVQFHEATTYRKNTHPSSPRSTTDRVPARAGLPIGLKKRKPVETARKSIPQQAREKAAPKAIELRLEELADQGRLGEALALCEESIDRDKLDAHMYFTRATILVELNRAVEAMDSLRKSLYLEPDCIGCNFTLGNLALRTGDAKTGRRCLRNAQALLGRHPDDEILPELEGLSVGRVEEIIAESLLSN